MSNSIKDEISENVEMEFEALKAIYLEDITIEINNKFDPFLASILVDICPKTGDNTEDQFVRLTLVVDIPKDYPNVCPVFALKNIRGLTDDKIEAIRSEINSILCEKSGETVIYQMIERSRDLLTTLNFPVGHRCALCLYEFTDKDQVMRNECFHHLHCRCFAEYVCSQNYFESIHKSVSNESEIPIQCPVCRIELKTTNWKKYCDPNQYSVPYLSKEPLKDESIIIEEAKLNQKRFQNIYERQLRNGGIIDSETQRNKFVLRISETNDQMIVS